MTFDEIIEEVKHLTEDDSFAARIPSFVNEAYYEAAELVDLPGLKVLETIVATTTKAWVNLPPLSSGKVLSVSNTDSSAPPIRRAADLGELVREYGDVNSTSGPIFDYTVEGTRIWYQNIPAADQTLLLLHYNNPDRLVSGGDIPIFPEHLHRRLLVSGAAKIMFAEIEQGIEGESAELRRHIAMFDDGVVKLGEWAAKRSQHKRNKENTWDA